MQDYSDIQADHKSIYRDAAEKFKPDTIEVLFITESPPAYPPEKPPEAYFYLKDSKGSDMFFKNIITATLRGDYKKSSGPKEELLKKFKEKGYFLMDAVEFPINSYKPVNGYAGIKIKDEDRQEYYIRNEIQALLKRLETLKAEHRLDENPKVILIKKTVYDELHTRLGKEGYTVLNENLSDKEKKHIGFPRYMGDKLFIRKIRRCLK